MGKDIIKGLRACDVLEIITTEKFKTDFLETCKTLQAAHEYNETFKNRMQNIGIGIQKAVERFTRLVNADMHFNPKLDMFKYRQDIQVAKTVCRELKTLLLFSNSKPDIAALAFYITMGQNLQRHKCIDFNQDILYMVTNAEYNSILATYSDYKRFDKDFAAENQSFSPRLIEITWSTGKMQLELNQFLPATNARMNTLVKLITDKTARPNLTLLHLQAHICDMINSNAYTQQQKKQLQGNLKTTEKAFAA